VRQPKKLWRLGLSLQITLGRTATMNLSPLARLATRLLFACCLAACAAKPIPSGYELLPEQVSQRDAASALNVYVSALRAQDSHAIAAMFVSNGKLEHVGQGPISGRENIESFLASFVDYKILAHDMTLMASSPATTHVSQSGTYVQRVRTPQGQEVTVRGWFLFQWQRQQLGNWLIEYAKTSASPLSAV